VQALITVYFRSPTSGAFGSICPPLKAFRALEVILLLRFIRFLGLAWLEEIGGDLFLLVLPGENIVHFKANIGFGFSVLHHDEDHVHFFEFRL